MAWVFALFLLFVVFWLFAFFYLHDFSVPLHSMDKFKNVLLVFPHPDDEVVGSGGLINQLSRSGKPVSLLILTTGEKGNPAGTRDDRLKVIRTREAETVSHILGISRLIQSDLGDGDLINRKDKVTSVIRQTISDLQPDLIITYDLAGLYGHPDHMLVSDVITSLIHKYFSSIRLWYLSYPSRVLSTKNLPEHMATDPGFKSKRTAPGFRIFIGLSIFAKIKALYAYSSQRASYKSALPFRGIPLWFVHSLWLYEYFYQAN